MALGLVGQLNCLVAGHQWCRGKPVEIWENNMGSVGFWKKGYGGLSTTQYGAGVLAAVVWWGGGFLLAVVRMCLCIMYVLGAINKEIGK